MSWFTPAELERAEAYHGPLARAELVAAALELALLVVAAAAIGPAGGGVDAAARIGLTAAAMGLAPRLLLGLWRELRHEPAHGLVAPPVLPPGDRTGAPAVAAVVVLDELGQFLGRAALCGAGVGLLAWWSACPPVVGMLVVPGAAVVAVALSGPVHRVWRFRVDRLVELPFEALPPLRIGAQALPDPRAVPVRWYRGGPATSRRGEEGFVFRCRSGASVVLSPAVLHGPSALLEAVAAHELGHVRALRPARDELALRMAAVAVVACGAGLALSRVLAGAVPGLWFVAGIAGAGELAGVALLSRRRRAEADADRWASAAVADPSECVRAVRHRLVEAGADLAPRGPRRWRSAYPPASVRLDLLAYGLEPDRGCACRQ